MASKKVRIPSSLEAISIRSLGVIEEATIDFAPGLNVITGETGAGKTMVLTALSLLLGGKSDAALIRQKSERLLITGEFSIGSNADHPCRKIIDELGGSIDEDRVIITRAVNSDGKSRGSLGGAASTVALMSEAGASLVALHGQHANLTLSKGSRQRELLDSFGGESITAALGKYRELLVEYRELRNRIRKLRTSLESRDKEIAELESLANEFKKIKPLSGELEQLEITIARLESVEELRTAATAAVQALDDEDSGTLSSLGSSRRSLSQARGKDPQLDALGEQIQEAFYSLSEAASALNRYLSNLDADPMGLENAQQRKASLNSFAKRFGDGSFETALLRAQEASSRMRDLHGGDDVLNSLVTEATELFEKLASAASHLTLLRTNFAADLGKAITNELSSLSMPNGRCEIQVQSSSLDSESQELKEYGADEVEMLFTSHGGQLLPIAKAASGGELSRLLLAIEVIIAGKERLGTYVFDEVDAGIGGKAALEVGRRLRKLAEQSQVIVVTHLPQVAIWADRHIVVSKDDSGSITTTSLHIVDGPERETEIARMLSGLEDSEHAQDHARELLQLRKLEFA